MRGKFVIPFVVLVVTAAALAAHAQVIADVERLHPSATSSAARVRVAPGPLVEGAQVYADRIHVYRNVPPALVGAEYVLMSNEDKYNPVHELRVTIGQAGMLYLIIDNRTGTDAKGEAISPNLEAAGMTWVTEMGFINTGMKMALDKSADGTIDNYYTVFSKPVSPGVIVLGAQGDAYLGGYQDSDMYGVAAVGAPKATNPVPADGGQAGVLPLLQWTPGVGAVSHDLYLGRNQQLMPADRVASYLQTPSYQVTEELLPGVKYFWRVDEVEADTVAINTGDVWSFTVVAEGATRYPDLLGWWAFNEGAGTLAVDFSGHGHDGQLCNGPAWVAGKLGRALRFDGVDDYVEVPHSAGLVPSGGEVTVMAWINAERHGGPHGTPWQGIIAKDDSPRLYSLYTHASGALHFSTGPYGNHIGTQSTGLVPLYEWVHVVAMVKDAQHAYYINGVPAGVSGTDAVLLPGGTSTLTIGRTQEVDREFMGMIDDVRLYDRALTAAEIERVVWPQLQAYQPDPPDGAAGVAAALLRWTAGDTAVAHDLYLGMDANLVEAADPNSFLYWGRQTATSFSVAKLVEPGGQYFWRVDEVEADGSTIHKGVVWTFTVFSPIVIDDFESYADGAGRRIEETWIDGLLNGTGSQVGRGSNPFIGGQMDGAHGMQSMSLAYDNTRSPFVSEVGREFVLDQDWTGGGGNTLSLWLQGDIVSFGETAPGVYTMSATGADIWVDGDEFRYAYKRLDGDGVIVAKVESVVNTDIWAKAGVMIRTSLDPMAAYAFMLVTPDGLRAFQNRPTNNGWTCYSAHSWAQMRIPSWIMLEREGDHFTGYHSVDGVNWVRQSDTDHTEPDASVNPQIIRMLPNVYIGLALTSHAAGAVTMATFSGVEITGDVTGSWRVANIGVAQPGNSPDDVYVTLEDSDGKVASAVNRDLAAVNAMAWTEWKIPFSDFLDVDLGRVRKMSVGVGGREATTPPGAGRIYVDDISVSKQTTNSILGIYLVDTGELVLSARDMAAYLRATHEIVLNESGIKKWNSYITFNDSHDPPIPATAELYQKQFVMRIDNREIYRGHFWSGVSSLSCEGVVILDAMFPCDSVRNTISIENGYPGSLPGADDPRENAELFNFLAALGLLK